MTDPVAAESRGRAAELSSPLLNGVGGLALFAMAVWMWRGAADIDAGGDAVAGPASFPRAVAVLLGATSLMVVVQAVRSMRRPEQPAPVRIARPLPVLIAIGLVVAYPALVTWLGYYVGAALWLVPFLWVGGMRSPTAIAATTAGFLLFTKVLFQMVLGTPLP